MQLNKNLRVFIKQQQEEQQNQRNAIIKYTNCLLYIIAFVFKISASAKANHIIILLDVVRAKIIIHDVHNGNVLVFKSLRIWCFR